MNPAKFGRFRRIRDSGVPPAEVAALLRGVLCEEAAEPRHLAWRRFGIDVGGVDRLCELGIQAWMTGTDTNMFQALGDRAQFFSLKDAMIERQPTPPA